MAYKIKKDPIDKIPKAQLVFWIIVRVSMIICAVYSFVTGDVVMGFESVFCFIFTHLWTRCAQIFKLFGGILLFLPIENSYAQFPFPANKKIFFFMNTFWAPRTPDYRQNQPPERGGQLYETELWIFYSTN